MFSPLDFAAVANMWRLSDAHHNVYSTVSHPLQVFTGQVPFSELRTSAVVMMKLIDDKRPQRPLKGKKLGLSDKLWEIIQSSLAHQAEERPPVGTFVEYLEKATPDMTIFKKLAEFDANSEADIWELHNLFEHGDNTLFGMRNNETLVAIEVFDRVGSLVRHRQPLPDSDSYWFQVLASSLDDQKLRGRCLRGLQKAASRWDLLPKSYWIPHSNPVVSYSYFSIIGRVSIIRQGSMNGQLVAVKTINPDCIADLSAFKRVRLSPFLPVELSDGIPPETVHQCGHVEATATSERGQFPWVQFRFSSFLPRVPLDDQWQPIRLLAPSSRCG